MKLNVENVKEYIVNVYDANKVLQTIYHVMADSYIHEDKVTYGYYEFYIDGYAVNTIFENSSQNVTISTYEEKCKEIKEFADSLKEGAL